MDRLIFYEFMTASRAKIPSLLLFYCHALTLSRVKLKKSDVVRFELTDGLPHRRVSNPLP